MTQDTLLDVQDLTVRFALPRQGFFGPRPSLEAVRQVSFSLEKGRALGNVGESGSGKTTTAMAAIRLVEAAEGKVLFEGRDLLTLSEEDMRQQRRDVALIFQDPYSSLNPRARPIYPRRSAPGSIEPVPAPVFRRSTPTYLNSAR